MRLCLKHCPKSLKKMLNHITVMGRLTAGNQKTALSKALSEAKSLLTIEAASFLTEAYGDLSTYLKTKIEAEVNFQK